MTTSRSGTPLAFQFVDRESSGSILDPDGPEGGAYDTFHSWLSHDGGVLLLGGVAAAVARRWPSGGCAPSPSPS